MISLYKIPGTSNIDPEQHRHPYTDKNFWPTFQEDMEIFKKKLIECNENNKSILILRMGHAEHCLFNLLVPDKKKGQIIKRGALPRHYTRNQSKETWIKLLKSMSECDYITTQIGEDFKNWIWDLIHYKNVYNEYNKSGQLDFLLENRSIFSNNYNDAEKMDMPLDIIYGLIANKWILKAFSNKIGFIGNGKKLDIIKNLMKHKEYQQFIHNDYFLDYIDIPQRAALENENLEKYIYEIVEKSECKIYLIGAGVSKLKFLYGLKKVKPNGIFIDVGHGLDAIAGIANYNRPYFGSWQNYKLKNYNYTGTDFCGQPSWHNVILL